MVFYVPDFIDYLYTMLTLSSFAFLDILKGIARQKGLHSIYLVGGCLRDLYLKRPIKDIDIATQGDVKGLAQAFARTIKGHFVTLDERWQTYRVVKDGLWYDFSPLKGSNIVEDLKNRDFTVNALALNIFNSKLIDPTGGLSDLKQKIIRVVVPQAFLEDPLRVLRALRLAAKLNFSIEETTQNYIKQYAPLLDKVASERIYHELKELFLQPEASYWIREMDTLKVLKVVFPEIETLKGVLQDGFHHLDVYGHSLLCLEKVESLIKDCKELCGQLLPKEMACKFKPSLDDERHIFCLKLAALYHDAGKPSCQAQGPKRITFYGHEKVGAELFKKRAQKLSFPNKERELVALLIKRHMWPFHLFGLFLNKNLTNRAIYRFLRHTHPYTPLLLLLATADNLAAQGPGKPADYDQHLIEFFSFLLEHYQQFLTVKQRKPLVNGYDIMDWFQLKPGPLIGRLLKRLEEKVLSGEIKNRDEARKFLRKELEVLLQS